MSTYIHSIFGNFGLPKQIFPFQKRSPISFHSDIVVWQNFLLFNNKRDLNSLHVNYVPCSILIFFIVLYQLNISHWFIRCPSCLRKQTIINPHNAYWKFYMAIEFIGPDKLQFRSGNTEFAHLSARKCRWGSSSLDITEKHQYWCDLILVKIGYSKMSGTFLNVTMIDWIYFMAYQPFSVSFKAETFFGWKDFFFVS